MKILDLSYYVCIQRYGVSFFFMNLLLMTFMNDFCFSFCIFLNIFKEGCEVYLAIGRRLIYFFILLIFFFIFLFFIFLIFYLRFIIWLYLIIIILIIF